ncbi:hypothetical protein B8W90_13075, partial [Staphylococcus hominis]
GSGDGGTFNAAGDAATSGAAGTDTAPGAAATAGAGAVGVAVAGAAGEALACPDSSAWMRAVSISTVWRSRWISASWEAS